MAQEVKADDNEQGGLAASVKELQADYTMLTELSKRKQSYAAKLIEMAGALQKEFEEMGGSPGEDAVGEAIGPNASIQAVVVSTDQSGNKVLRPLDSVRPDILVGLLDKAVLDLKASVAERRKMERMKVKSLENTLRGLKRAQYLFGMSGDDSDGGEDDARPEPVDQAAPPGGIERSAEAFTFNGSFGSRPEAPGISA